MTSAPRSPRSIAQYGPARTVDKSQHAQPRERSGARAGVGPEPLPPAPRTDRRSPTRRPPRRATRSPRPSRLAREPGAVRLGQQVALVHVQETRPRSPRGPHPSRPAAPRRAPPGASARASRRRTRSRKLNALSPAHALTTSRSSSSSRPRPAARRRRGRGRPRGLPRRAGPPCPRRARIWRACSGSMLTSCAWKRSIVSVMSSTVRGRGWERPRRLSSAGEPTSPRTPAREPARGA